MNIPHRKLSVDINRINHLTVDLIGHINDKNTRYIDLTFTVDGAVIELEEGCTASVTYTSDGFLIAQDVPCEIENNAVVIGFDNEKIEHARSGILAIQPMVTDSNDNVLALQIPIYVRVSADIAQTSQVDGNSMGSYAEVVREIAKARGEEGSLGDKIDTKANANHTHPVDSAFSLTSTNPIQNVVVTRKINEIVADANNNFSNVNTKLSGKVDSSVYNQKIGEIEQDINGLESDIGSIDLQLGTIEQSLGNKADKTSTYTKEDVNEALSNKTDYVRDVGVNNCVNLGAIYKTNVNFGEDILQAMVISSNDTVEGKLAQFAFTENGKILYRAKAGSSWSNSDQFKELGSES